jgi:hypothetical protein
MPSHNEGEVMISRRPQKRRIIDYPHPIKTSNLIQIADANPTMADGLEAVRRVVADSQVAVALWPDDTGPDGVATLLIKGAPLFRAILTGDTQDEITITAIRCIDGAQAMALSDACGEREYLS